MKHLYIIILIFFCIQKINAQTDPYPYRGIYVDQFIHYVNGNYPTIREDSTILGRTAKEDSLLKFARDNDIKYLILYDLEKVFAHPTATLPNSGGRDYRTALCDFITKAKTNYCIKHIGAIVSSKQYLDSIPNFSLVMTDPYDFNDPGSAFLPSSPNPISYVSNNYTDPNDPMALRSEMVKTALRINNFNSLCSYKIDAITTEYEFWQQYTRQGCMIKDTVFYKNRDTLIYHGNVITTGVKLENGDSLTVPSDSIKFDGIWKHYPVNIIFCKTNAMWWQYRQLLHDMATTQAGASHPIILDTYLGWYSKDTINDLLQTKMIDSVLNRVSLHTYHSNPVALWGYFANGDVTANPPTLGRDSLFAHNSIPNTVVHPIFSAEPSFSGTQINSGTSLFEVEKSFRSGYASHYTQHHDNDSIMPGSI